MGMQGCRALFIRGYIQSGLSVRDLHCGQGNKEAVGVLSADFQLYGGLEVRWYGDVKWNPLRGEGACQIN